MKALKESIPKRLASEGNLFVSIEETYEAAIIYLYCGFDDFTYIHKKLFKDQKPPAKEAYGYCSFGESSTKGNAAVVWINSNVDKALTIGTAVHEISHAVDDILESAGVKDVNGEARAYTVERETKRILEKFYGIKCNKILTEDIIMEALQ